MCGTTLKRMSAETAELKTIKETLSDLKRMVDAQSLTERASKMIHLSIPKILIQRKPKSPTKESQEDLSEHRDTISTGICIQLTPPSPDKRRKVDIDGVLLNPMFAFRTSKADEVKREDQQAAIKMETEEEPKLFADSSIVREVNTTKDAVGGEVLGSNSLPNPEESGPISPPNPEILQKQSVEEIGANPLNGVMDTNQEKEACASVSNECEQDKRDVGEKDELADIKRIDCRQDENKQQSIDDRNAGVVSTESNPSERSEKVPQCEEIVLNNELNSDQPAQVMESSVCDPIIPENAIDNLSIKTEETNETNETKETDGADNTQELIETTENPETNTVIEAIKAIKMNEETNGSNGSKEASEAVETKEIIENTETKETNESKKANESKEIIENTEANETNELNKANEAKKANEANEAKKANEANEANEAKEASESKEASENTENCETANIEMECETEPNINKESESLALGINSQSNQSNEDSNNSSSKDELNVVESTKNGTIECETATTSVNSGNEIEISVTSGSDLNESYSTVDHSSTVNVTDLVHSEISKVFSQSPLETVEGNKSDMEIENSEKDSEDPSNVDIEKEEKETTERTVECAMEIEDGHVESTSMESTKMEEENGVEAEELIQQDDDDRKNNSVEIPSEIEPINELKSSDQVQNDSIPDPTRNAEPKQIDESVLESGVADTKEVKCTDEPISVLPTVVLSVSDCSDSSSKLLEPQRVGEESNDLKSVVDSPIQTNSNALAEIKDTIDPSIHTERDEAGDVNRPTGSPIQSESNGPNYSIPIESTEIKETAESPISSEVSDSHSRNLQVSDQPALDSSSIHSSPNDSPSPMPISPSVNQQSITDFFPVTKNHSPISQRAIQKDHAPISQPTALNPSTNDSPIPSPFNHSASTTKESDHLQSTPPLPSNHSIPEPFQPSNEPSSIPLSASTPSKPSSSLPSAPSAPFKPPRSIESSLSSHPPPTSSTPPSSIPPQLTSVKDLPLSLESKMNSILNQLDSQLSTCHQPYRPVARQPTPPPLPPPSLPISHLVFVYISNRGCAVVIIHHSHPQDRIRLLISYILHTPSLLRHHPVLTSSMLPVPEFLSYMKEKQLPSIVIPILEIVVDGSSLLLLNDESIFKSVCSTHLTIASF